MREDRLREETDQRPQSILKTGGRGSRFENWGSRDPTGAHPKIWGSRPSIPRIDANDTGKQKEGLISISKDRVTHARIEGQANIHVQVHTETNKHTDR